MEWTDEEYQLWSEKKISHYSGGSTGGRRAGASKQPSQTDQRHYRGPDPKTDPELIETISKYAERVATARHPKDEDPDKWQKCFDLVKKYFQNRWQTRFRP